MSGKKILIIDDDPDLVEAVSMLLESEGMVPLAAYGGEEGIKMAVAEKPDLIILDVMMPDKDGFAVAKELSGMEEAKNIPKIMLTAVVENIEATNYSPHHSAMTLEADDWMDKPVDPRALVARIKELVG